MQITITDRDSGSHVAIEIKFCFAYEIFDPIRKNQIIKYYIWLICYIGYRIIKHNF